MAAVYQLLGFPGTGKYTVARALVAELESRGESAALWDNHATANLVWGVVPVERRFDPVVMQRMTELRHHLLEIAEEVADPGISIVFTSFIPGDRPTTLLERHRALAEKLGHRIVAVTLRCDTEELLRRVSGADRAERMKLVDVDTARRVIERGMTLPDWPELVDLDVTRMSPADAARRIADMAPA